MIRLLFAVCIATLIFSTHSEALAVQESRALPSDSRLRVITYNPNSIHKYRGFYEYQASILFGEGEQIKTISMGNPAGWQMVPSGRRLFLKPIADFSEDATTNMLLITNKRTYHFILEAAEAESINDPNLVWETSFIYPEEDGGIVQQSNSYASGPDLSEPEKYNFNYSISGAQTIAPIRIFDDKQFTYFQFSEQSGDIPAFFLVDSEGREALINYRLEGNYVVIERVGSQFTLRHGKDVVCVFNESRKLESPVPKRKTGFFGNTIM